MVRHYQGVLARFPARYFLKSMTPGQKLMREKELLKRRRVSYSKLSMGPTNKLAKRRPSRWTGRFHSLYPGLKFNKNIFAKKFGIPRKTLDEVYNKGLKAWKTGGSRVGANPHQWAIARVYKFILIYKKKVPVSWYKNKWDPDAYLRKNK
jgi:Family of unknown function (DUF5824)